MDIERLKNNREFEFHDRIWDDQTQIVMFYKEQPEFRNHVLEFIFHVYIR